MKLYAQADVFHDAKYVYCKLGVIGMYSEPLLELPGEFMGPFPTLVRFKAEPISGTFGYPHMSRRPASGFIKIMAGSVRTLFGFKRNYNRVKRTLDCISWGPDSDADCSAIFYGHRKCWDGVEGLSEHIDIPRMSFRYKKWRFPPYACPMSTGFSNHCVDHTFKWRKSGVGRDVVLDISMQGRVGFLRADGRCLHKPYKYTLESITPSAEKKLRVTVPPASP